MTYSLNLGFHTVNRLSGLLFNYIIYYYGLLHIILWFIFGLSKTFFVLTIQFFNNVKSLPSFSKQYSPMGQIHQRRRYLTHRPMGDPLADRPRWVRRDPSADGRPVGRSTAVGQTGPIGRWATRWPIHRGGSDPSGDGSD